ncbi:MAG: hypothetical protein M1477_05050 [Candidatus Thermoplasmatota archaeon]|nr:hypothetical protein [Candidatus Thermoplasmatota archaeon]
MPKVDLTLSSEYKLYTLPVTYHVSKATATGTAVFDSGSAGSSITERLAEKLNVDLKNLPYRTVSGVTGIQSYKLISQIDIMLPNSKVVTLQNVTVLEDVHKEKVKKINGIKVGTNVLKASVPNLLGLDFLTQLNGTIVISPAKKICICRMVIALIRFSRKEIYPFLMLFGSYKAIKDN